MSVDPARPTVDDVALLLRARTKDASGNEVGTFDAETRPTDLEVEQLISRAAASVGMRLPATATLPAELQTAVAGVIALGAACLIEKSYWPEQVEQGRSPYVQLKQEYDEDLRALVDAVETGGGEVVYSDIDQVAIGSWTSITVVP